MTKRTDKAPDQPDHADRKAGEKAAQVDKEAITTKGDTRPAQDRPDRDVTPEERSLEDPNVPTPVTPVPGAISDEELVEAADRSLRQGRAAELEDALKRRGANPEGAEHTENADNDKDGRPDQPRKAACFEVQNWHDGVLSKDEVIETDVNKDGEGRVFLNIEREAERTSQREAMEAYRSRLVGEAVTVNRHYLVDHPHTV